MIDASTLSKLEQAALSLFIRLVVIGAIAIVDYLIAQLSAGAIQLPDPGISIPIAGLVLSEADTWLVKWEKANVPNAPTA